jgi:hypothetical protein
MAQQRSLSTEKALNEKALNEKALNEKALKPAAEVSTRPQRAVMVEGPNREALELVKNR